MKGSTFFERNAQVTYAALHFIHTEVYQILNAKYSKMSGDVFLKLKNEEVSVTVHLPDQLYFTSFRCLL